MDLRTAIQIHLRHAADAFGKDLPLPKGKGLKIPAAPAQPDPAITAPDPAGGGSGQASRPSRRAQSGHGRPARQAYPELLPAASLEALAQGLADCTRCKLCETRKTVVFGEGNSNADVLFIGEGPGAVEDERGRPFVGPAGQLLDKIIENAMGLRREDVYIANVVKCRPPGNRNPEPDETGCCISFLREQIRMIQPKVIVALGRTAAQNLLGSVRAMRELRGKRHEYEGTALLVTWHPAYLLRQPAAKRETWEDIKSLNKLLGRPEVPDRK